MGDLQQLILIPTEEISFRSQPVIAPETLIRRVPVTEQLICLETTDSVLTKIGVPAQWLKVRDCENQEGFVAAWYVKLASTESLSQEQQLLLIKNKEQDLEEDLFSGSKAYISQEQLEFNEKQAVEYSSLAEREIKSIRETIKMVKDTMPGEDVDDVREESIANQVQSVADHEQLEMLKQGVKKWNDWRVVNPGVEINLSGVDFTNIDLIGVNLSNAKLMGSLLRGVRLDEADLSRADLRKADLREAYLVFANLSKADLRGSYLGNAYLKGANLNGANLEGAGLSEAYLYLASLSQANLVGANLQYANLWETNLCEADLSGANLTNANLVFTKVDKAIVSKSNIFGVNVWNLYGEFNEQRELVITPPNVSPITVDNIKVAQFIYLILNNKEVRDVLNTLTSKTVLILGRFALPERKVILDSLRNKLREYNLLPIVFDFERPDDKDFTETIKTLAGMCYFVIADVTNPKSSPLELQATVPDYQIPFVPIIQEGENPFAMMVDLQKKYDWVLDTISYKDGDQLIRILKKGIIDRAMKKHDELRLIKSSKPTVISASQFEED